MFTQYFIINGRPMGQAPRDYLYLGGKKWGRPLSELFVCKHCGDTYAQCPVVSTQGAFEVHSEYAVHCGCCEKCNKEFLDDIPGSLMNSSARWMEEFYAAFPEQVLQREIKLHIKYLEKYYEETQA